jgi:hypothetical protein
MNAPIRSDTIQVGIVKIQEEAKHQKEKPLQAVKKDEIMWYY